MIVESMHGMIWMKYNIRRCKKGSVYTNFLKEDKALYRKYKYYLSLFL